MELNIPLDAIIADVERSARRQIHATLEEGARRYTRDLMQGPHHVRVGTTSVVKTGAVFDLLRKKIYDYALSDTFEAKIQELIERHMDEAAEEAVRNMLRSAARRRVFGAVPHK